MRKEDPFELSDKALEQTARAVLMELMEKRDLNAVELFFKYVKKEKPSE